MAFPQQAKIKMNFAQVAVRLFVLIPLLSVVHSEPDALIRFADGSVVEIENRPLRQQLLSSASSALSASSASPSSSSSSPVSLALSLPPSLSSSSLTSSLSSSSSSSPSSSEAMNPSQQHGSQQQGRSLLHDNNHRIETRATKQHFCGPLLVSALALVCKGSYYKKRSGIGSTTKPGSQSLLNYEMDLPYYSDMSLQGKNDNENNLPDFFELLKAANGHHDRQARSVMDSAQNGLLLGGMDDRPIKRGVSDECCRKPCSTYELSLYCKI